MKSKIQKAVNIYEKYKWWFWFIMGLIAVFVFLFPYFYLRENAYFMIHDELDDGIFKYMLNAKHFGDGTDFIPEFMGGQSKSSIVVSSLWGIILYKILSPYNAFLTMMTISVITGYIGVFLLGRELSDNAFASFFAASVFSYLPFKSMFALNIVGFPILIWALLELSREKNKKVIIPYIIIFFYSTGTTLAWAGFMSIGFLSLFIIVCFLKTLIKKRSDEKEKGKINLINLVIADSIICAIHFITSYDLIKNTFGNSAVVSHREEMTTVVRTDYVKYFLQMMHFGGSHSECCSFVISISSIILLCIFPILYLLFLKKSASDKEKKKYKKKYYFLAGLYLINVLNAAFSCIWSSPFIVSIRLNIGGVFKTFQFDRIYWIMPSIWMCVLILEISLLLDFAGVIVKEKMVIKKALALVPIIIAVLIMFVYSKNVYLSSVIYHNLRLIVFPNTYHVDSWKDYYAEELFDDIEQAIGRNKSEYRVASVAINPAVALYNGFYTLDGYSTDYPLEYKHQFRTAISRELEKDTTIQTYFDEWGSRCYIFSTEIPLSTGLNNVKDSIDELDIDTKVLKEMGADYIFSNAEILNSDQLNLIPIKESAFEKSPYKYKIWVYEIN